MTNGMKLHDLLANIGALGASPELEVCYGHPVGEVSIAHNDEGDVLMLESEVAERVH